MAYALPLWRSGSYMDPDYAGSAPPTNYITPTDAKRWLTSVVPSYEGFNEDWRPYFPSLSGYLEGTVQHPEDYMPAGMWDDIGAWYGGLPAGKEMSGWAAANPLPQLDEGAYRYMNQNWYMPGQGSIGTYTPPAPLDPKAGHRAGILDDIMRQGVMGRTSPGSSNLGVMPQPLKPLQAFEQPMQQFSVLNQWNTMPKWDMGAGPNWAGM